jgi:COP9 signalosome complex subunit 6
MDTVATPSTGSSLKPAGSNASESRAVKDHRWRIAVKQVFPTLEVIGWYAVGEEPTLDDVFVQQQVGLCLYHCSNLQLLELVDTPIFLLFHPSSTPDQDLPVTIYESALAEGSNDDESAGKFA